MTTPPCGCTAETRCAFTTTLRDEFVTKKLYTGLVRPESQQRRREIITAYTAHLREAGLLADAPPGTESWPIGEWPEQTLRAV